MSAACGGTVKQTGLGGQIIQPKKSRDIAEK